MTGRSGLVFAIVLGFNLGCRDAPPQRQAVRTDNSPDAGMAPSPAGAGGASAGGASAGGAGGAATATASPTPFVFPNASFAPGSVCEVDGWCWYNRRPSGDDWQAVAGVGRADLWIGGASSTLLHLGAGRWSTVESPLTETDGIWGASAQDVWFVGVQNGNEAIAHWDGQAITLSLTLTPGGEFKGVWGSGAEDVYAVAADTIEHWNGTAWTAIAEMDGTCVSGSGPNDVWVGLFNGMLHFDGTSWSRVPQLEGDFVDVVATTGPSDVWVQEAHTGSQDVNHFDGKAWTVSFHLGDISSTQIAVGGLAASAPNDAWIVGQSFHPNQTLGYLAHFDGGAWTVAPEAAGALSVVTAAAGFGDVAVGSNGEIDLLGVSPVLGSRDLSAGSVAEMFGVWGASPTNMWAVGSAGTVLNFDGSAVSQIPSGVAADLRDVWGTAPNDVWMVGTAGTLLHFDGTAIAAVSSGTTADLFAVFTAGPGDVWIGGDSSTLLHLQGGSVQPVPLTGLGGLPFAIDDLHGLAPNDVWLAGGPAEGVASTLAGFVSHFDGKAWSPAEQLTQNPNLPFQRIWELGPDDVWADEGNIVGDLFGFFHFDGTAWTEQEMPNGPATFMFPAPTVGTVLNSFVFGPHDRWIVGDFGEWQRNTQ